MLPAWVGSSAMESAIGKYQDSDTNLSVTDDTDMSNTYVHA